VVAKPVTQAALREGVVRALGCEAAVRAGREGQVDLRGLRVLVAEDNEINRTVTIRVLQRLGCYPDVVFNGREAVEAFARDHYDAVLMDLQMPEMDGFEATMEIRRSESAPGRRVPIVAVTAHALPVYRERCLATGMDDCVVKPVDPRELDQVLRRLCGSPVGQPVGAVQPTDDEDPGALLAGVLDEVQAILARAETALAAGGGALPASTWHGLRASCAKLGADGLGLACNEVRLASADGDLERAQRALTRARDELARLVTGTRVAARAPVAQPAR
jgi:CheY-like chemotaxis protein